MAINFNGLLWSGLCAAPKVSNGCPNIFCQISMLIIAAAPVTANIAHFRILNGRRSFLLGENRRFGKNRRGNSSKAFTDLVRVRNTPIQIRATVCLCDNLSFWVNRFKVKAVTVKTATFVMQSLDSDAAM